MRWIAASTLLVSTPGIAQANCRGGCAGGAGIWFWIIIGCVIAYYLVGWALKTFPNFFAIAAGALILFAGCGFVAIIASSLGLIDRSSILAVGIFLFVATSWLFWRHLSKKQS